MLARHSSRITSILTAEFLPGMYGSEWSFFKGLEVPDGLISWADLGAMVDAHWHDQQVVRLLVRRGQNVPLEDYVAAGGRRGTLRADCFRQALQDGCSLTLDDIASFHPRIGAMVTEIEKLVHEEVDTRVFVAGPRSNGLGVHYDPHDVFAVQLLGSRPWRIYRPTLPAPRIEDRARTQGDELTFVDEVANEAGRRHVPAPRVVARRAAQCGSQCPPDPHDPQARGRRLPHVAGRGPLLRVRAPGRSSPVRRPGGLNEFARDLRAVVAGGITPDRIERFLSEYDRNAPVRGRASLPWDIEPETPVGPEDQVVLSAPRTDRQDAVAAADDGAAASDVTALVLKALSEHPVRRAGELAKELNWSAKEMAGALGSLRKQGLISVE